jgi:hypothetical protein
MAARWLAVLTYADEQQLPVDITVQPVPARCSTLSHECRGWTLQTGGIDARNNPGGIVLGSFPNYINRH